MFSGALYNWTYSASMDHDTQNELRDQKLYNAVNYYNYDHFLKEGRIAVIVYAIKITPDIIQESMILHVTVEPCVPFVNNVFADYSYLFPEDDSKYDALAERYDH